MPNILPGENQFLDEMTRIYGVPREAALGGAQTLYPEYRKQLQPLYVRPQKCNRYCCGWQGNAATETLKDCVGDYRQIPGFTLKPPE